MAEISKLTGQKDPTLAPAPHREAGHEHRLGAFIIVLTIVSALPALLLVLIIWGRLSEVSLGGFAQMTVNIGLGGLLGIVLGLLVIGVLAVAFLPWRWSKVHMPLVLCGVQMLCALWMVTALVPPLLPPQTTSDNAVAESANEYSPKQRD